MSEYEVGAMEFQYLAEFAVYPKGKDQSLCYCTDRARAEMIVTALNERDMLRRQVEALAGKIVGLGCVSSTFGGYHKDWEELTLSEQAGYWIAWSIKQAKKGGGGEATKTMP